MAERSIREWETGQRVEAYHPMRHGSALDPWEPATVTRPATTGAPYVRVRWDDGGESTTFHLNVRLPGEIDPVRLIDSVDRPRAHRG